MGIGSTRVGSTEVWVDEEVRWARLLNVTHGWPKTDMTQGTSFDWHGEREWVAKRLVFRGQLNLNLGNVRFVIGNQILVPISADWRPDTSNTATTTLLVREAPEES